MTRPAKSPRIEPGSAALKAHPLPQPPGRGGPCNWSGACRQGWHFRFPRNTPVSVVVVVVVVVMVVVVVVVVVVVIVVVVVVVVMVEEVVVVEVVLVVK